MKQERVSFQLKEICRMNFVEITSDNNWFKKHPEKVAGIEYETTSMFFPIMVKGTKEDVLRVVGIIDVKDDKSKRIKFLELKAKALKIKLILNNEAI